MKSTDRQLRIEVEGNGRIPYDISLALLNRTNPKDINLGALVQGLRKYADDVYGAKHY